MKKKDNKYRRISGEHSGIRLLRNTPKTFGYIHENYPDEYLCGEQ